MATHSPSVASRGRTGSTRSTRRLTLTITTRTTLTTSNQQNLRTRSGGTADTKTRRQSPTGIRMKSLACIAEGQQANHQPAREQDGKYSKENMIGDSPYPPVNRIQRTNSQARYNEHQGNTMQKVHTSQLSRLGSQDSHPHFHTGQGGRPLQLKESNQNSNMAQLPRAFGIDQVGMPPNPQNWANPHHFKRSETQIDPATAHLQHFGNPYFRKQKSSYAEIRHGESN
jgi:hypothetical protein